MSSESPHPLDLWFVRHGESKNNAILSSAGGLGTVLYPLKFSQDPLITEKGIKVAAENGQRLLDAQASFDLVFCSTLMRTMETAYYMFVKTGLTDTLHVAPYISELPLKWNGIPIYENMPIKRAEQIKLLGTTHGGDLLDKLDFSLVGGSSGNNDDTLPPSGDKFFKFLWENPLVVAKRAEFPDRQVRIAIVTHSHFLMEKETLRLDSKPDNADIWLANLGMHHDLLLLTDLKGWYRESIAQERAHVDHKIEHTEKKLHDKQDKYRDKIQSVESGEKYQEDEEKKTKKIEKYMNKLEKKVEKYNGKKGELEERKEHLVNLADIQISEFKQVKS